MSVYLSAVRHFLRLVGIALLFSASLASADQNIYRETDDGWFIYAEDRSCVMYGDYIIEPGTEIMLRFSARTDENRMYFTVVSDTWEFLTPAIGETVLLSLNFPEVRSGLSAPGMVIRSPDSRMGYAGSGFGIEEVENYLASNNVLEIEVGAMGQAQRSVAGLTLNGAAEAVMHLAQCNETYFPRR